MDVNCEKSGFLLAVCSYLPCLVFTYGASETCIQYDRHRKVMRSSERLYRVCVCISETVRLSDLNENLMGIHEPFAFHVLLNVTNFATTC